MVLKFQFYIYSNFISHILCTENVMKQYINNKMLQISMATDTVISSEDVSNWLTVTNLLTGLTNKKYW